MDYGVIEKFAGRDLGASLYWNGAAFRAREKNPDVRFGYPVEGYPMWMDAVVVLKDAKNVENASFSELLDGTRACSNGTAFARYANGIKGSEPFMPDDMKGAPEVDIAAEFVPNGFAKHVHQMLWKCILLFGQGYKNNLAKLLSF